VQTCPGTLRSSRGTGITITENAGLKTFTWDVADAGQPFGPVLSVLTPIVTIPATYVYSGGIGITAATLPSVSGSDSGKVIAFKEVNGTAGAFTVNAPGGALIIEGAASKVIGAAAYAKLILQTDGVVWWVIG
jgi:hypothetical protein